MIRNSSPCMRQASLYVSCMLLEAWPGSTPLAGRCEAFNKSNSTVARLLENLVVLPGALECATAHLESVLHLHAVAQSLYMWLRAGLLGSYGEGSKGRPRQVYRDRAGRRPPLIAPAIIELTRVGLPDRPYLWDAHAHRHSSRQLIQLSDQT